MRSKRTKFDIDEWFQSNQQLFESINYDLNIRGDITIGDERNRALIVVTLARLPEEARAKTLDEVCFIIAGEGMYGTPFDLTVCEPKTINCILLNFSAMRRQSDSRKMDTIAHEIAHYWLSHSTSGLSGKDEREADRLIEEWGFRRAYLRGSDHPP